MCNCEAPPHYMGHQLCTACAIGNYKEMQQNNSVPPWQFGILRRGASFMLSHNVKYDADFLRVNCGEEAEIMAMFRIRPRLNNGGTAYATEAFMQHAHAALRRAAYVPDKLWRYPPVADIRQFIVDMAYQLANQKNYYVLVPIIHVQLTGPRYGNHQMCVVDMGVHEYKDGVYIGTRNSYTNALAGLPGLANSASSSSSSSASSSSASSSSASSSSASSSSASSSSSRAPALSVHVDAPVAQAPVLVVRAASVPAQSPPAQSPPAPIPPAPIPPASIPPAPSASSMPSASSSSAIANAPAVSPPVVNAPDPSDSDVVEELDGSRKRSCGQDSPAAKAARVLAFSSSSVAPPPAFSLPPRPLVASAVSAAGAAASAASASAASAASASAASAASASAISSSSAANAVSTASAYRHVYGPPSDYFGLGIRCNCAERKSIDLSVVVPMSDEGFMGRLTALLQYEKSHPGKYPSSGSSLYAWLNDVHTRGEARSMVRLKALNESESWRQLVRNHKTQFCIRYFIEEREVDPLGPF